MTAILLVAVGGALGASVRYVLASAWRSRFPWAILVANVAGSFVLGLLIDSADGNVLLFTGVGFCGALTTFSTFALDTLVLAREGRASAATLNVVLSAAGSIAAFAAGLLISRAVLS